MREDENQPEFWQITPGRRHGRLVNRVYGGYDPREPLTGYEARFTAEASIEGHPRLVAHVEFVSRDGERVVSSVRVHASDPAHPPRGGITVDALRNVKLGRVQNDVADLIANEELGGRLPAFARGFLRTPRPGRAGRDPRDYAEMARVYVRASAASRTPVTDLAERYHLSAASIRAILNKARALDLLTPAPPGRAGGELTDKARKLLRDQGD